MNMRSSSISFNYIRLFPLYLIFFIDTLFFLNGLSSQMNSMQLPTYIAQSYSSEYGPIKLDLSNAMFENDKYILPSVNTKDQKLYIAISCTKYKINITNFLYYNSH